jgi:hypothetical protein
MRRILIGGSYVGAVAAGAVASAQLWMHSLSPDESSAIREVAVPGTQARSVPVLVEPLRPRVARPSVSPSPFTGFLPIFVSSGSVSLEGGTPVANPAGGGGGVPTPPGSSVPGSPVPGSPEPGQPIAVGGSTPSGTSTPAAQAPTASAASAPPPTSTGHGTTEPAHPVKVKPRRPHAQAVPAVPAQPAQPPEVRPATPATPAVPPGHAKPAKPEKPAKHDKAPKQNDTSPEPAAPSAGPSTPAPSNPSEHGNGGGNGQGNGKGNGKK